MLPRACVPIRRYSNTARLVVMEGTGNERTPSPQHLEPREAGFGSSLTLESERVVRVGRTLNRYHARPETAACACNADSHTPPPVSSKSNPSVPHGRRTG